MHLLHRAVFPERNHISKSEMCHIVTQNSLSNDSFSDSTLDSISFYIRMIKVLLISGMQILIVDIYHVHIRLQILD